MAGAAENKKSRRSFLTAISGLVLAGVTSTLVRAKELVAASAHPAADINISGTVYLRGDSKYESSRKNAVWQAIKPPRYPDLIVKAQTEADITNTIKYAKANNLRVSVRCGGHSYVASPLRNGGILLDVSGLRKIEVDPAALSVKVGPGINAAEFSTLLGEYGLGFPVAHCPTITLGGYLLGGGMGWNGENWGRLACFNVRAVDLITAAGEHITASNNSHPELFWAVRGAGPAFCAVVTRYYLEVFPLPGAITANTYIYSIDALDSVINWLEDYKLRQHPKVELTVIFKTDDDPQQENQHKSLQCIVSAICFADESTEAKTLLEVIAQGAPKNSCIHCAEYQPMTFEMLHNLGQATTPMRHAVDTIWTSRTREVLQAIGTHFINTPSGHTHIFANYRAIPELVTDAAYSVIAPMFILSSVAWESPGDDFRNFAWADDLLNKTQPFTEGCYINETDFVRHPERLQQCFAEANRRRLAEVCARYDPTGMFSPPFRLN